MKILKEEVDKKQFGIIELMPEEHEDLWHLFNLIEKGDNVRTLTGRKFQRRGAGGVVNVERVKTVLTLKVTGLDFDKVAGTLRVSGKSVSINQFVKVGQYHTATLRVHKKLSILKHKWNKIHYKRLQLSSDVNQKAEVAAVMMEDGLCNVCLVTNHMTLVKQRIEMSVSKKRYIKSHEKKLNKFFNLVLKAIKTHINFDVVKACIIASPGFLNDQFKEYCLKATNNVENKGLFQNIKKFVLVHANSGNKQSLKEVLQDKSVLEKLQNTKCAEEIIILNKFFRTLSDNPNKAVYGAPMVYKAQDQLAIDSLLISDKLFRSVVTKERVKFVKLVENVEKAGGKTYIFSSMHVTGEQLNKISGVAALLRYPIPELFEEKEEKKVEKFERQPEKAFSEDEFTSDSDYDTSSDEEEEEAGESFL